VRSRLSSFCTGGKRKGERASLRSAGRGEFSFRCDHDRSSRRGGDLSCAARRSSRVVLIVSKARPAASIIGRWRSRSEREGWSDPVARGGRLEAERLSNARLPKLGAFVRPEPAFRPSLATSTRQACAAGLGGLSPPVQLHKFLDSPDVVRCPSRFRGSGTRLVRCPSRFRGSGAYPLPYGAHVAGGHRVAHTRAG
jgi:hypothetical protein